MTQWLVDPGWVMPEPQSTQDKQAAVKRRALSACSTDELLAEIVRRRNARVSRRPILKCDECQWFKPCGDGLTDKQVDAYNPCTKGYKMSFRYPEADDGPPDSNPDWGHYLRCCPDRKPI